MATVELSPKDCPFLAGMDLGSPRTRWPTVLGEPAPFRGARPPEFGWTKTRRPDHTIRPNSAAHFSCMLRGVRPRRIPTRRDELHAFVLALSESPVPKGLSNPYQCRVASENLLSFLNSLEPEESRLLLIGEAPGYRGAAITGIPFCSLSVLLDDWGDPWGAFGSESPYQECDVSRFRREATATIFWRVLADSCAELPLPLTWNAVPFHPRARNATNRPVHPRELEHGRRWIEELLELFPRVHPVAVGRVADLALERLGLNHGTVRHPSRGGKQDFADGLSAVVAGVKARVQLTALTIHPSAQPLEPRRLASL